MRRSFALAAPLAALASLAALVAEPAPAKEQVYFTVTLQEARLAGATAQQAYLGRNDGRLQQLQLQSIEWGPRVTKIDSFTVKQSVRPIGTSDLTMKRGTGVSATGENVQGAPDIVITASRIPWPQGAAPPPPEGSMRVKVRLPWLACEEGKTYRRLIIGDAATRYELSDVVVAGCGAGAVAFDYARIARVPARPR
jgi:hypothetical protein